MSAVEPLFSHHAATDVLKNLFSPGSANNATEARAQTASGEGTSAANTVPFNARTTAKPAAPDAPTTEEDGETAGDEQDMAQAEAKEISAEPSDNVHVDHFITQPEQGDELAHLTKSDLVHVLETFVNVLMEGKDKVDTSAHTNLPRPLSFEPREGDISFNEVVLAKNAEIDELKTLLVEAQGTIITLLTDRVEDKAKLATFESQMRFLPDYQGLHTQPTPSKESDEMRADLTKVKDELQNIKNSAYKSGIDGPKLTGIRGWLAKLVGTNA